MKLFTLLSRFIATFGLLTIVTSNGWATDGCAPSDFIKDPLSAATPYVLTANVTKVDSNTYYFRAPSAGTVDVAISGAEVSNGSVRFSYGLSSCPGTTSNLTSTSQTLSASDLDFNIKVYDTTNNASAKDYTITVTFIPHTPPIMGNISNQRFTIDTPFTLDISNYVTLTEGDPVTYTLTGNPSWLVLNSTTGVLNGTPDANGTFTLSVTATDDDGVSNSDSFTLSSDLLLAPPVMGNIPDQDIIKDIAYSLNIANYASTTGSPITSYHIVGTLPIGLSFNTATGVLTGQPTVNGVYPLSAYATNNEGNSTSDDFNITVSRPGVASDLLIVKTPSVFYSDSNRTVQYIITLANETSSDIDAQIEDVLKVYNYSTATGITGSEVTGKDLNITIVDDGVFECNGGVTDLPATASSFSCEGTVPRRTGNGGVPGLVRIIYTITTPDSPAPALLLNTVGIEDSNTEAHASVIVGVTPGGVVITPPPEHADVIDTDEWTSADSYNAVPSLDKVIKTKISAKPFMQMSAVHLDGNEQASIYVPTDPTLSFLVIPYLSNNMCSEQEILYDSDTGKPAVFNITNGNIIDTKNITIPDKVSRDSRISVSFIDLDQLLDDSGVRCAYTSSTVGNLAGLGQCVNSANNYYDAFGLTAYERCQTRNGRPCEPTNHGEANPSDPTYNPLYDNELGCLMCTLNAFPECSSDNFAIRPNEFNSSIAANEQFKAGLSNAVVFNANKFGGTGVAGYNESETALTPSFAVDLNISDSTKTCAQPSLHFDPRVEFSDGLVSGPYKVINVGDFNVTMHEINGSEYALVDADDTNDSLRLITPFMQQIKVIPHHFGLDGNFTNRSNGFTYLSNFEDYNTSESRNISAALDFNITAQALDNSTTSNYTESCYAKDGNVTMTLPNALVVNPAGSLTKMLWYDQNHDINGSIALGGTTYRMDMNATQFDSVDVNGTARVKYLINFDRDEKLVVNPMTMTISQVTATDTDAASGTKVLISPNNSANYVYGRIMPRDIRIFGSIPFSANGWYEVFGTTPIGTTALPVSKNDSQWSTNTLHNDLSDGDSNVTRLISSGASDTVNYGGNDALGVEVFGFPAITPTYNGKAHVDTAPWLWYAPNALMYSDPSATNPVNAAGNDAACLTHPCFNISVVPAVGATGSAKGGAEGNKASKKSDSSGWRSTTDYAPAIR